MNHNTERILLVENDPDISDLVARQVLSPLGYQVRTCTEASQAILEVAQFAPDLVITNLNLPGLSGKDLLVALNSQGNPIPLIVVAAEGEENSVIQAFRLGACDYLLWPAREGEIVSAVERVITQVRERHASQRLSEKLRETNEKLEQRVRELTTIFAVGKAVLSITDQGVLFDKIVEGMLQAGEADQGWLLLRNDKDKKFVLAGQRNLPQAWASKIGAPLDDGISSLVALSGETLVIHGEALQRFKIASLGKSAMVVPLKVRNEVIGLLVVMRKADEPFDQNMQTLLEAISDHVSISLVNLRLFRALEDAAQRAKEGERSNLEELQALRKEITETLQPVTYPVELLLSGKMGKLNTEQLQALQMVQSVVGRVQQIAAGEAPGKPGVPATDG